MPWELEIIKYDGPVPRLRADVDETRLLPLGTVEDVRAHVSETLPAIEWQVEPPLIEVLKASGSDSWKHWDESTIESASQPTLKACYELEDLYIEIFGFKQASPLRYLLMEVRGEGDPLPVLRALCKPTGWSVADMCKDAVFLDLDSTTNPRWEKWRRFLGFAMGKANREDNSAP
jgi:hypothetical protein